MQTPSLIELIDKHLVDIQDGDSSRDMTLFHPSAIGYCTRKIVYDMLEYPSPPIDSQLMRIFECGHSMHHRFEHWLGEIGIQIAPELVLSVESPDPVIAQNCKDLEVTGRTDSLIVINETPYLVELKSANTNMFKYYLTEPKLQHVQQLQLYMHLTGIHQGFLLYEDKNTQELKEFYITYDARMVQKLITKIRTVMSCYRDKVLPPKEGKPSDWQCKSCGYRDVCQYPNRIEAKALLKEYTDKGKTLAIEMDT